MRRIDRLLDEARELESRADHLRREADAIGTREAAGHITRQRQRAIRATAMAIARGKDEASEIDQLCRQISGARRDLAAVVATKLASVKALHKIQRNREICRLARTHTNGQIAARFGLTDKHVSRILNAAPLDAR